MSEVRHPRSADMVWLYVFRNGQAAQKMQREMLGMSGLQIAPCPRFLAHYIINKGTALCGREDGFFENFSAASKRFPRISSKKVKFPLKIA